MKTSKALDWLGVLMITLALASLFFRPILWGGEVYYVGDIARLYLPQRYALARALAQGRLPWWAPEVGIGYPLVAEGEIGAFYPFNLVLSRVLTPEQGLSLSIVLHYLIAGVGLYLLARALRITRRGALLGGIVYALGGFNIAHLSHVSILSVSAWLPWLLMGTYQLLRPEPNPRWRWALALGLVTALQFLAGHPQISLLNLIATGAWGVYLLLTRRKPLWQGLGWWAAAFLGGGALALPQLLATGQLTLLSQRAQGLEGTFFSSYSFHPFLTATLISPFLLGKPHPLGAIELMGYVGILPLLLAPFGARRSTAPTRWFWIGLGIAGLALAFGRWNPAYALLERVPLLNLFRAPARYLLWTSLSLAMLAASGLDRLLGRNARQSDRLGTLLASAALLGAGSVLSLAAQAQDLDTLVACWRWIPLLLAASGAVWLLGTRRVTRAMFATVGMALLLVDLYAYGAVLSRTYNQTQPLGEARRPPRVLEALAGQEPGRIYVKEEILPILSVQKESLYPNMALTYGVASANMYLPLIPRHYEAYLQALDASRLNKLNVRYYLIPQLLPVDEASELYDVLNPFAAIPYGQEHPLDIPDVVGMRVTSYASHAADLPDGTLAAEIHLQPCQGEPLRFPLRIGLETAEWAYERSDVAANVRHRMPRVATTFPARSGFPPEDHAGHTYLASWDFAPQHLCGLRIVPALPEAFIRIERIEFLLADGSTRLASHALGLGDHSILYRSEDVLVYENHDALPRAYAVPLAQVQWKDGVAWLPEGPRESLIPAAFASDEAEQVILQVQVAQEALLVLADLYYPGWEAQIDGQHAEIVPVEGVFRGVILPPGQHEVRFWYARRW